MFKLGGGEMPDNYLKSWFVRTISHSLSSCALKIFWRKTPIESLQNLHSMEYGCYYNKSVVNLIQE